MTITVLRGPILNPKSDGSIAFIPDGAIAADAQGRIEFIGDARTLSSKLDGMEAHITQSAGVIVPPFLDCHTHIPQHPIRGRFTEGVPDDAPNGRLLGGLERNVFPKESLAQDQDYAEYVVRQFAYDTLSQGVIGGASFMTVHAVAARVALSVLPKTWSVGHVLMNMNCPNYLRTHEETYEQDTCSLAEEFGKRLIITDRFAVSVTTALRKRAVAMAQTLGLRMQTHLNEQQQEKAFVENVLYPNYASYTDVYRQDGLLDHSPILAHCIQMTDIEWDMVGDTNSVIAHCPTSNMLLGSGTMPLDIVRERNIPYAICSDVGASPTTSLLCEMVQFLKVHAGRAKSATPQEALYRTTLAPAQILGLDRELGSFEVGKPLSYVEIETNGADLSHSSADEVILEQLLGLSSQDLSAFAASPALNTLAAMGLEHGSDLLQLEVDTHETARRLEHKVLSVTIAGHRTWQRPPV